LGASFFAAVLVAGFFSFSATGFFSFSAAGFFSVLAGGEAALVEPFLASLTGPDGPLGRRKSPDFSPDEKAALRCLEKAASLVDPRELWAWMYFLIAWRL